MAETIGFLGLGQLGLPMAQNLLEAGHALRVYNRTADKADPLVARGAQLAARPVDALSPGGVVVSVLWDDASVEGIVDDAFLERLGKDGLHIAMTTIAPETSRRLAARHAAHGSRYLDAPVFGRPEAAAARRLWIPIAGEAAAKERARPVLEALGGKGIFDFGVEPGAAMTVKLAGNFLIMSAMRSLGEALSLASRSGVDPHAVVEMLTATMFGAPIYQSYGKMVADLVRAERPAPSSPIGAKDIGLFRKTAAAVASPAPLADALLPLLG